MWILFQQAAVGWLLFRACGAPPRSRPPALASPPRRFSLEYFRPGTSRSLHFAPIPSCRQLSPSLAHSHRQRSLPPGTAVASYTTFARASFAYTRVLSLFCVFRRSIPNPHPLQRATPLDEGTCLFRCSYIILQNRPQYHSLIFCITFSKHLHPFKLL